MELDVIGTVRESISRTLVSDPDFPVFVFNDDHDLNFGRKLDFNKDRYFFVTLTAEGHHQNEAQTILSGQFCQLFLPKTKLQAAAPLFIKLEEELPRLFSDLLEKARQITGHHTELTYGRCESCDANNDLDVANKLTVEVWLEEDENLRDTSYAYATRTVVFPKKDLRVDFLVYFNTTFRSHFGKAEAEELVDQIFNKIW